MVTYMVGAEINENGYLYSGWEWGRWHGNNSSLGIIFFIVLTLNHAKVHKIL